MNKQLFSEEPEKDTKKPILSIGEEEIKLLYDIPGKYLRQFNRIKAITFSSLKSILDLLKDYREVEILIGLEEQGRELYNLEVIVEKFLKEGEEISKQAMFKDFSVYYIPNCHTKLYILESEERKIVVAGSGNLSSLAWRGPQEEFFL
ncbi:hypothetical protein [Aquifex aeolicus]|nr:hypothetical protein [Aquifex aeolicus]